MQHHFANWNVVRNIGSDIPWPYPPDGARTYIERRISGRDEEEIYFWGIFLKHASDELIGAIEYRFLEDDDDNRGFWLSEDHWGKGIMTEAVAVTQDFVFFELQKPRVVLRTLCSNVASKRVKQRTGGSVIGTARGSYHEGEMDQDVWEITRESWAKARGTLN